MVTTAIARTAAPACQTSTANPEGRRAELREVAGECRGQSRHRAGADDQELDPAEQKREQRPVRRAQVNVEPAGLRHHRAQLGERQRPAPLKMPPMTQTRMMPLKNGTSLGDLRRHQEDPRADRAADDHAERVDRPQHARQLSPRGG